MINRKKIILSLVVALFATQLPAQLKVNANGSLQMYYSNWTGGLKIETQTMPSNFAMTTLYPVTNWYGALGTSSSQFGFAYINHLYYNVSTQSSDKRLKKNIAPGGSVLGKISTLGSYTYNYAIDPKKLENLPAKAQEEQNRQRIGFMAQEVQEVFPQLVYESDSGMLSLDYIGMVPILLQAIKEQQVQIASLKYQLNKQNSSTKAREEATEAVLASYLVQNYPNPFTASTQVQYNVAPTATTATIMVFDMAGTLLRTYENLKTGEASISIEANELKAGMYMYSLIVDGVELDSKRMILTK